VTIGGRSRVGTPARRGPLGTRSPIAATLAAFTETFPNDGPLDSTGEDLTWNVEAVGVGPTVSSGAVTGIGAQARAEHDTSTRDMFVAADAADLDNGDSFFLIGRAGDTSEIGGDEGVYLYVQRNASDTYIEIGGWLPSGVIDSDTLGSTADATWRLELSGMTATMLRNGVQVLTGTCSNTPVGTRAGFQVNASGSAPAMSLDNFTFGDL